MTIDQRLNLVLEATNIATEALVALEQVRMVVVVIQAQIVCNLVENVLSRTPEIRLFALAEVPPIVESVSSRERREPESIRTITTVIPSGCGLEHLASRRLSTDSIEQCVPFC